MREFWQALVQIWRLTYPYFTTRDVTELRLWPLPRVRLQERWVAITLALAVIGIEFAQVAINVRLSYFNRDWFNAIQNKDEAAFWSLLFTVFLFWAFILIASSVVEYLVQSALLIRWRRWLTKQYVGEWLDDGTHYRMSLRGAHADNPDQRISEDIKQFADTTYAFSIQLRRL